MSLHRKMGFVIVFALLVTGSVLRAVPLRYTLGGDYAAVSEAILAKALKLKEDGNMKALQEMEKAFLITKLKSKIDCEIVGKSKKNRNYIKILLLDADIELWTVKDAVKMYTPEEMQGKRKKRSSSGAKAAKGEQQATDDDWQ